ncbi:MAG: epoxyqueuosine reductase, partial [Phycisphaeraceae bacterium]
MLERALDLGFALAGVAPAEPSRHADHVRSWLAEHRHGEMHYLAEPLDVRLDPNLLVPQAKSILLVADAYPTQGKGPRVQGTEGPREEQTTSDAKRAGDTGTIHHSQITTHHSPPSSRIARYAWGDDYHKVMKKRLFALADALREGHPEATFRCCVDTAPLLEREHAARAGMGWIGKHTLLLHPRHGSFLLLGAIVTDLELASSETLGYPRSLVPPADHCGTCTRCIDACPTGCIFDQRLNDYPGKPDNKPPGDAPASPLERAGNRRAREKDSASPLERAGASHQTSNTSANEPTPPRAIDAARCISYLTIEHRSAIVPELHAPMGDWLIGCDVCQEVCPYNNAPTPPLSEIPGAKRLEPNASTPPLSEIPGAKRLVSAPTMTPREPLPIHLRYRPRETLAAGLDPFEVLRWTEDDRRRVFRGSALKRVKLDMLHRNALIVLTNTAAALPPEDPHRTAALAEAQRLADDPDTSPLVQETARVCIS